MREIRVSKLDMSVKIVLWYRIRHESDIRQTSFSEETRKKMVVYCPKCHWEFSSKRDLERHLQRKIPCDQGEFKCTGCSQGFQTKQSLKVHEQNGKCKGKKPMVAARELAEEVADLKSRMQEQEKIMQMTNDVTAKACSSSGPTPTIIQNITINIHNHPVCGLGKEKLTHFSAMLDEDILAKLRLSKGPTLMENWCAMLRADEDHPENHNALLLAADSTEMACCRDGEWSWGDRDKTLLEISRSDMNRLYTHLGRYEQNPRVQTFRNEYVLHDLMAQNLAGNELKEVMDAVAKPIIALTQKFYTQPTEDHMTEHQRSIQKIIEQTKQHLMEQRASFEETRIKWEKFEASQIAALFELQRHMALNIVPLTNE